MSENVVNLNTGRTVEQDRAEIEEIAKKNDALLDQAAAEHKEAMLKTLDGIRERIEANEIEGFVFAGRNPANGAFLSTAILNTAATRVDAYLAYAGILEATKLDMVDLANAGPHMNPDGSFFALGEVLGIDDPDDDNGFGDGWDDA